MTIQKVYKAERYSAKDLKNLHILPKNSAGGFRSRREHNQGYKSDIETTPKKLTLKSFFPLNIATTLLSGSRNGTVGA